MKIHIYYGGRGLIDDPTLVAVRLMMTVFEELNVKVTKYDLFDQKNNITTLPQTLKRKVSIESERFYFTGENLCYDSPLKRVNKYIDPEEAAVNVARVFTYRWQKTFMLGIDVTF